MRIRKEVYLVLAVIVILTLFIVFRPKAEKKSAIHKFKWY